MNDPRLVPPRLPVGESGPDGAGAHCGPGSSPARRLHSRAEAEAYIAAECFAYGPVRAVGVELEWILQHTGDPSRPLDLDAVLGALGAHAPVAGARGLPMPSGSLVRLEPGGQVKLVSAPLPDIAALVAAAGSDVAALHARLAAAGLRVEPRAADPHRPARRVLHTPRFDALEHAFDRIGPHGRTGMCSTAAVQVTLDAGEPADLVARWAALHAVGPVLVAVFANSPLLGGRRTGWKSSRLAAWLALDPARTVPPRPTDDPVHDWAERVLATPLLYVPGAGPWTAPERVSFADWIEGEVPGPPPTTADLDDHISTLFPPVRPRGFLEVRYVDAQQGGEWRLPVAVLAALTARPETIDRVRELCGPASGRWVSAARYGLEDRVVAQVASAVFALACAELDRSGSVPELVAELERVCERRIRLGRCPADDALPGESLVPRDATPDGRAER